MNRTLEFLLFSLLFTFYGPLKAQTSSEINNLRSDTVNVIHYDVTLNFVALGGQQVQASCGLTFSPKMPGVNGLSLDLLGLIVDSVKIEEEHVNYSYNDTLLRVHFDDALTEGALYDVAVYYHGHPQVDASSFGGFYFQGDYIYNIGVGFDADPHNYGRVWHPCFDNFVERATYTITLVSAPNQKAYANGQVVQESTGPNNENIRTWAIDEEIPSYLACFAVAEYEEVNQSYTSLSNTEIPIVLAAKASDTAKLKASFVHLPDAMEAYELSYGPYRWNKVGYTLVPFNGGAMEHATCIMYPIFAANGNTQWETLMAHELSHHWWGNLVTCRTAEDMWINEGLAAYSESLFLEHLYGENDYLKNIKETHKSVLQSAHFKDGGFLAISGVPTNVTYGAHTYDKGAIQMHNLRSYLGDEDFFLGLKAIQNQFAFKAIDVFEFRDALNQATGKSTNDFFENYLLNPGFNGFEIDSFMVKEIGGEFEVEVFVQQKVFEAPHLFTGVPLQVSFINEEWEAWDTTVVVSGTQQSFTYVLPSKPEMVVLNREYGLMNAVLGEEIVVKNPQVLPLNYVDLRVNIVEETDSSLLRIESLRIAPDPFVSQEMQEHFVLSPDRYWKIDGLWSDGFFASARFSFNAKNTATGNLDNGLMQEHDGIAFTEDSLVLLWRPSQAVEWSVYPFHEVFTSGSATDGACRIEVSQLKKGEYTFGFRKKAGYSNLPMLKEHGMLIYPNPVRDELNFDFGDKKVTAVKVFNQQGQLVDELKTNEQVLCYSTNKLIPGNYQILVLNGSEQLVSYRVVKN